MELNCTTDNSTTDGERLIQVSCQIKQDMFDVAK